MKKIIRKKKSNEVRIGLLGLGTVGSELANLIGINATRIDKEYGIRLNLSAAFVRDVSRKRNVNIHIPILTTNPDQITKNPDIDVVCECIGGNGFEETRQFILDSLHHKKDIILSSKKALALYAPEFIEAGNSNQVQIRYDATVGGGIPISKVFEASFRGDTVTSISGILNATSNYIYSKMENDQMDFSQALKQAQQKGYAENNPSDDVDGFDALYKICILTMLGMKRIPSPQSAIAQTFRNVELCDMQYASELGYSIKPLALADRVNGHVEYHVGPTLISNRHILANTFENYNSIMVKGNICGQLGFYGQGAGDKPTASAMFDDLLNLILSKQHNLFQGQEISSYSQIQLKEKNSKKYWRLSLLNEPGALANVTSVFAHNDVNIEKILQKNKHKEYMELVLITGIAKKHKELFSELSKNPSLKIENVLHVTE
jgi:homoserine dehydrogenase